MTLDPDAGIIGFMDKVMKFGTKVVTKSGRIGKVLGFYGTQVFVGFDDAVRLVPEKNLKVME